MSVFRFRDFQFDTFERRLTRNGEWVELTPKAMDILEVFVGRPGQLITRDEIIGKIWGNTLVEEGNLSVHISKLRKALAESRDQRFIQTVAGAGYRFTTAIEQITNGDHSPNPFQSSNSNDFRGSDPEALRLLLKGKYLFENRTRQDVIRAIDFFEKSLTYDAGNVRTYAELVLANRFLYLLDEISLDDLVARTQPWLATMYELEPDSDVVQVALGEMALYCSWDRENALRHFRTAVEKNPRSLLALFRVTYVLLYSRRFPEAIRHLSLIAAIDPFSVSTSLQLARFHYFLENYQAAITYLNDALELDPENFESLLVRGVVLAELHSLDEAEADLQKSFAIYDHVETIAMLGYVSARKNKRPLAEEYIEKVVTQDAGRSLTFTYQARIRFVLGDFETGYEYLEKALRIRAPELLGISVDPRWRDVRDEPRFLSIVKEVGFV